MAFEAKARKSYWSDGIIMNQQDLMEVFFGLLMGGIPVGLGVFNLTNNFLASCAFGFFATFLIALIIEGNRR